MQFADPTFIAVCLSAVAFLGMLAAMLRRGKFRETSTRSLLALVFISLAWMVFLGLLRLQTLRLIAGFDTYALSRIALYFLLVAAVIFLQLTRLFQRRATGASVLRNDLLWWGGGALALLLVIALYENLFRLPDELLRTSGVVFLRWLVAFAVLVIGWAVFMGVAVLYTIRDYHRTVSPLHRNRNKYWSAALTLAIAAGAFVLAQQLMLGSLLHLLAVSVALFVLLTYNLPDLRNASRSAASYVIMTLLTVAIYTGGFLAAQAVLRGIRQEQMILVGLGLAVALSVLFNPLLNLVNRFITRLISGSRYDSRQTLSEYSMSISNILDMDVLATIAIGLISEAMEITRGALVTVSYTPDEASGLTAEEWEEAGGIFVDPDALPQEEGGGVYILRSISGLGEELPEGRLSGKNPAVYCLRREHHPLAQYDIDLLPRFQVMEPEERAWLAQLNMDLYVPIYAKDNWIGMLALGPKASGDRYFDEDLDFLQTLADQTAVALENARLYENLKQRNAENERLNAELKTANEELARLDRAKSDFINIASHELRTPLTQVVGYNDILAEMIKSNQVQPSVAMQMTDSVRKAARRLEEIVETMFDVSKLDTRTLDLMRAPVSMASVVTVAIDTWQKGMQERKLSISVRGVNNLPVIYADGKRLTQVFSHLIQNAVKSTPDGGQIGVTARVVEADGARPETVRPDPNKANGSGENGSANGNGNGNGNGIAIGSGTGERYVEVVVSDTGIGIAAEDLNRIFDKFYRVGNVLLHSTGDTKFKGAGPGLGLTIARGIIEAHGGTIWAESPGHDEETCPGAKFHVLLPIEGSKKN